jgi:hypothetical protein
MTTVPLGVKSYLPTLLLIGQKLCNYIRKYESTIVGWLGDDGQAVIDAVLVACEALEVAILLVLPPKS